MRFSNGTRDSGTTSAVIGNVPSGTDESAAGAESVGAVVAVGSGVAAGSGVAVGGTEVEVGSGAAAATVGAGAAGAESLPQAIRVIASSSDVDSAITRHLDV